jgi:uncharacterized protein YjiK
MQEKIGFLLIHQLLVSKINNFTGREIALLFRKAKMIKKILPFAFLFLFSCETEISVQDRNRNKVQAKKISSINFYKKFSISVPEPSGLCFVNNSLWTVSDQTNSVYQLDLKGNILQEFTNIGKTSLEGITFFNDKFYLVDEENREIITMLSDGTVKNRKNILSGSDNNGLEAITIDKKNKKIIVLKEKNPGKWLELDFNFNLEKEKEISFSSDFSGICFSDSSENYLVLGDKNQKVYVYHPDFDVSHQFNLDINKPEGIAINTENSKLYIVSDKNNELYIFNIIFL